MSAATILKQMESDGVHLALSDSGTLKTMGDSVAVNRWLPTIREHKAEIITALQAANDPAPEGLPALSDSDERRILAWLASIGETDAVTIGEVIDKCRGDLEARAYFIGRAHETDRAGNDDRHYCRECQNLRSGICTIARPGGLVSAQRGYRPVPIKHRCAGFLSENNIS